MAAQFADPPVPAQQLQAVGQAGGGLGILQFGIEAHLVGEAVVPLVIAAVKGGVVEAQQAGDPGTGVVEAAAGKGGAVAAFVHGRKAGGQANAAGHQAQQSQGQGQAGLGPEPATSADQQQVGAKAHQAGSIAQGIELGEVWAGNQAGGGGRHGAITPAGRPLLR